VGTIAYASPEQLTDAKAVGAAADIYSLGASLYHLLTDRPPFVGNASEVLSEARRAIFPAPRTLNKSVPPALESICLKAMSLPVEERFSTVDSFAEALKSWLSATA
jgi:serine/threonine protein kinase